MTVISASGRCATGRNAAKHRGTTAMPSFRMHLQMSTSVRFDSGHTYIDSYSPLQALCWHKRSCTRAIRLCAEPSGADCARDNRSRPSSRRQTRIDAHGHSTLRQDRRASPVHRCRPAQRSATRHGTARHGTARQIPDIHRGERPPALCRVMPLLREPNDLDPRFYLDHLRSVSGQANQPIAPSSCGFLGGTTGCRGYRRWIRFVVAAPGSADVPSAVESAQLRACTQASGRNKTDTSNPRGIDGFRVPAAPLDAEYLVQPPFIRGR